MRITRLVAIALFMISMTSLIIVLGNTNTSKANYCCFTEVNPVYVLLPVAIIQTITSSYTIKQKTAQLIQPME